MRKYEFIGRKLAELRVDGDLFMMARIIILKFALVWI